MWLLPPENHHVTGVNAVLLEGTQLQCAPIDSAIATNVFSHTAGTIEATAAQLLHDCCSAAATAAASIANPGANPIVPKSPESLAFCCFFLPQASGKTKLGLGLSSHFLCLVLGLSGSLLR